MKKSVPKQARIWIDSDITLGQKNSLVSYCDVDDGYGDVWIVELDLSGEIIWQNCYGGSYYDLGYQIIETEDGYIIFTENLYMNQKIPQSSGIFLI